MLKWLTKKVYNSLTDVLAAVYKELDSLQPVDTDTVKWTKGLTGMKAHAVVQNSPVAMNQVQEDIEVDSSYKSSFKLIFGMTTEPEPDPNIPPDPEAPPFVPEPCILLVQGADVEDDEAGVVTVVKRATALHVLKTELPIVDGDIYLNVIWNPSTGLTYSVGAAVPLNGNVYQARIGRYNAYDKTITQIHLTGDIHIMDWPTAYDGAFKVGVLDDKLYLYDGSNPTSVNAGIIYAGSLAKYVAKTELAFVASNIYVGITYLPEDESWVTWVHQGNIETSPYYTDERTYYTRVAVYSASVGITQMHITGDITVVGRWVS